MRNISKMGFGASLMALAGGALADVPADVTTAITQAGTDASTVVYALASAGVVVLAATWIYRKVRG